MYVPALPAHFIHTVRNFGPRERIMAKSADFHPEGVGVCGTRGPDLVDAPAEFT